VLAPGNLFALLLLLGVFMSLRREGSGRLWGQRLCLTLALLLFFVALFPVGDWLLIPLENRFSPTQPDRVDGILLLTGDESPRVTEARRHPAPGNAAERYLTFATLARQYPEARLVFTGGANALLPSETTSNAAIARAILEGLGVPKERLITEDASRNTYENATAAFALVQPKKEEKWLLVTSAYHMPRAMGCFLKAGWNVEPAPTEYHTTGNFSFEPRFNLSHHMSEITLALHEYYGLIAYALMGRIERP
ncbi:MAG: YdcF family protein, partial [Alphaproteobacteria bacterium]|nr:YdcF family protein [Alphaproteobacteria bacterium]